MNECLDAFDDWKKSLRHPTPEWTPRGAWNAAWQARQKEIDQLLTLKERILENLEDYQNTIMNAGWTRHQQSEIDDVTDLIAKIKEMPCS